MRRSRLRAAVAGCALGIDARQVVDGLLVLPEVTLLERYGAAGAEARPLRGPVIV